MKPPTRCIYIYPYIHLSWFKGHDFFEGETLQLLPFSESPLIYKLYQLIWVVQEIDVSNHQHFFTWKKTRYLIWKKQFIMLLSITPIFSENDLIHNPKNKNHDVSSRDSGIDSPKLSGKSQGTNFAISKPRQDDVKDLEVERSWRLFKQACHGKSWASSTALPETNSSPLKTGRAPKGNHVLCYF